MRLWLLLLALAGPPPTHAIDPSDVPSFRFTCWTQNSMDTGPHPPPDPPAHWTPRPCNGVGASSINTDERFVGPTPPPPTSGCPKGSECVDGTCCTGLIGESRGSCVNNASGYAYVLGTHPHGPSGQWYNPKTWDCVSLAAGTAWGNWSAEFTPAMAQTYVSAMTVRKTFPMLPAQLGVRSARLDEGILNVTCVFRFTASSRASDDGKMATVTARVRNTNCSTCPGWTGMQGDDGGGYIGVMLGRDDSGEPTVQSYASFNRERYFSKLPSGTVTAPTLFPIVDLFETDADLDASEEAFEVLTQVLGVNTPTGSVVPAGWTGRTMGFHWGQADPTSVWGGGGVLGVPGEYRKSIEPGTPHSVPCYTPNSSCTLHDYCTVNATDAELVNASDIAGESGATFTRDGSTSRLVASPLADEPGWRAPFQVPVDTSPVVQRRWVAFLEARGMTPELLGFSTWSEVVPVSAFPADAAPLGLPARRLFYWSIRFIHWDSCRYMAEWTAGLQAAAGDPALPAYVNWNNFDGRMYVPGKGPYAAPPTPDAAIAQMSYDWFEWARMRGGSVLWTEDWMSGHDTSRWTYYASRLRSAASLADASAATTAAAGATSESTSSGAGSSLPSAPPPPPLEFSGYIVAGTAASGGAMNGALLLRPLALVGSGSKLVRYYNFGPEYMFPANSYSESENITLLLAEIARANAMIAAAEHVLWPARRSHAQVAILYPRSATLWDQWHFAKGSRGYGGLCLCCCTSSMIEKYIDYTAEVYGLYLALATDSNIPVDFVDEDALSEPTTLEKYRVIFVTQPNVPAAGAAGLAAWVKGGGNLVTVSGAGAYDEYDTPMDTLSNLAGVREAPRDRIALESQTDMGLGQPHPFPEANGTFKLDGDALRFTAQGAVGKLTRTDPAPKDFQTLASFDDGSAAVTSAVVGKGRAIHFAWLPGLQYWFAQECTIVPPTGVCVPLGKPSRNESLRRIIASLPAEAGVAPPVNASSLGVETPLMLTPERDKAVVTLLNFGASVCTPVNASVPNCHTPTLPSLALNVSLPFKPTNVTSIDRGKLAFSSIAALDGSGWIIGTELPLDHGDFVLFE